MEPAAGLVVHCTGCHSAAGIRGVGLALSWPGIAVLCRCWLALLKSLLSWLAVSL